MERSEFEFVTLARWYGTREMKLFVYFNAHRSGYEAKWLKWVDITLSGAPLGDVYFCLDVHTFHLNRQYQPGLCLIFHLHNDHKYKMN